MTDVVPDRVQKIEKHVNETLREDLRKTIEAGDVIYAEIAEYLQLQNLLEKIRDFELPVQNVKTMVDIGCNVYVKGVIPSTERIYLDVGLGFHLECTHEEAMQIVEKRISFLNERTAVHKKRANTIKAHIKLLLEGLRELQGLKRVEKKGTSSSFDV